MMARHEDGGGCLAWWCSKEWCVAPTCPVSRGRRGGEEGRWPFKGGGAQGRLSPVEVVGSATLMKSNEQSSLALGVRAVTCCGRRREAMGVL
jgi:hypothetical protein